jgi:chromosome segregation ATPase
MAALLERQHGIIEARMEKQQDKMEQKIEQLQEKMETTVERQRVEHREDMELQRETAETQRQEAEAKLEEQRRQTEQQRQELETKAERLRQEMEKRLHDTKPQRATEAITEGQLEALQARLQGLHEAKLLSEDDLCCLEDTIADCIEVLLTADVQERSVDRTVRMSQLSEKMAADAWLARQLRRKFV